MLRLGYLILGGGLVVYKWPLLFRHAEPWPLMTSVVICMLVAGNRYFEGVMVVGLAIGVIEALVTGYLSSSLRDAAAFFVLIGVLYFRPNGLFGSYAT